MLILRSSIRSSGNGTSATALVTSTAAVAAALTLMGAPIEAQTHAATRAPATTPLSSPAHIPIVPGLTIVSAVSEEIGDYEVIESVQSVGKDTVWLSASAELPWPWFLVKLTGEKTHKTLVRRAALTADLLGARTADVVYVEGEPLVFPGSTPLCVSRAIFNDLETRGTAAVTVRNGRRKWFIIPQTYYLSGTLRRVDPNPVPFEILLNDKPVTVAALHTHGHLADSTGRNPSDFDWYLLDDPDFPLRLKSERSQVVKIEFPTRQASRTAGGAARAGGIERALAEQHHAITYGIYFSFASDSIRPESDPVLQEIADAMQRHPDWKLRLEGHTDSVGSAPANLELSTRRVEAAKRALVERYHVDRDRLTTAGFGKSHPIATNTTPEGRARNRRVELTLQ